MSTQLKSPQAIPFDDPFFQHGLPQCYRAILQKFRKVVQASVWLHLCFAGALLGELSLFLALLGKPLVLALALGVFFLTLFSWAVLFFYFQTKKPEQCVAMKEEFLHSCRKLLFPSEGHHYLELATALLRLASYLDDFESKGTFSLFTRFCYRKDILEMQEILVQAAIEEHLKQIRLTPTDLEVHASLASAYVDLSQLYEPFSEWKNKFLKAMRLAIEEFRILSHYAPDDPWAHEQMADGYKAMKMIAEETREIELLTQLKPQDPDLLLRLGLLYFQQGENAKGLKIYDALKELNYKKSEELIVFYGI